ncbi:MAG: response regulator, partial [Acetanaerobacterium sp.]
MYKLMIIDDEYEQVQGIRDYIDWDKYDIEVCGVAYNGRDGLVLLKEQSPDIAIIDIQMPYLNGLSLIEKVNVSGQNVQIIILSGHDNFEYAREAIHLKANNYLLKPCSIEEILQAVLCAKNLVADEQDKRNILSQYHPLFQTHKASLKKNFLINLLEDSLRSASTFFQDTALYDVNLTDDTCCIAVFRFIEIDELYSKNTHEEFDHLLLSVLSNIKAQCLTLSHSELILYRDDLVLIVSGEESGNLFPLIQSVYQSLCDSYVFGFAVGIG